MISCKSAGRAVKAEILKQPSEDIGFEITDSSIPAELMIGSEGEWKD
jgi:hypothetical protein